jgi:transcriptional regulator with XRE-family HTH domain
VAGVTQDPEAWARLGTKIRERRESLGWSRRTLSEEAGVSEKSIQVAEEGRTPRARWPQSLRLIERALRWEQESMQRILEGGEPEEFLDLFSVVDQDAVARSRGQEPLIPAVSAEEARPLEFDILASGHGRSTALAALPKPFRSALVEVLHFGRRAASYGADPALVEEYERDVELLLLDLVSRLPLSYEGASSGSGRLMLWESAMKMDPVLRKERDERMRSIDRERRQIRSEAERLYMRTPVVGETTEAAVLAELRQLAMEVARLSEKVDGQGGEPSAG